jgi:hypothetical protein
LVAGPEPEPTRPAAKIGEPIDGRFTMAVDCTGTDLAALSLWSVGKGFLGICGVALQNAAVFAIPAGGSPRLAPEVFKDLRFGADGEGATYGIFDIEGSDFTHLRASVVPLMSRIGISYRYRRDGGAWKKTADEPFDRSFDLSAATALVDGAVLGEREKNGELTLDYGGDEPQPGRWLPARTKVPGCPRPVAGFSFLGLRGKVLWGIGNACGKLAAQRWTVGSAETSAVSLGVPAVTPAPTRTTRTVTYEAGETLLYVESETRVVLRFDGKAWQALGLFSGEGYVRPLTVAGTLWLWMSDALFRTTGAQLELVPVPDAHIEQISSSPSGEIRVWTGEGLYSLAEGDLWRPVTLPSKVEKLREIRSLAGRWIYSTEGKGLQLFIEGQAGPSLRIDTPPSLISPMGYVTPLFRACEHPFATLYKLGKGAPKDYDFPSTRAALAGQGELIAGRFSEVAALGDRYLVARYEGPNAVALLSRLTRLVEKKVQGAKPQLLCADSVPGGLPVTRDVSMK